MAGKVACLLLTIYTRAWLIMLAWGAVSADLGIPTVGYQAAVLAMVAHLWLSTAITYDQ